MQTRLVCAVHPCQVCRECSRGAYLGAHLRNRPARQRIASSSSRSSLSSCEAECFEIPSSCATSRSE